MLTIADRIKYYRKQQGLTQQELADLAGIHPVSIRKYETNKMRPQQAQIEKVARALHVNSSALRGFHSGIVRLDTVGNLVGLLMEWHKSGIMCIEGERDENQMLRPDSVRFVPNPVLGEYFMFASLNEKEKTTQLGSLRGALPDNILSELLRWEGLYYKYGQSSAEEDDEEKSKLLEALEEVEMQSQGVLLPLKKLDKIDTFDT